MRYGRILVASLLTMAVFVVAAQEKGGEDLTGPYDVVQGWPKLPLPGHEGWVSGPTRQCWLSLRIA